MNDWLSKMSQKLISTGCGAHNPASSYGLRRDEPLEIPRIFSITAPHLMSSSKTSWFELAPLWSTISFWYIPET